MPNLKRQNPFNPKVDAFEPSIETKRKWMLTRKLNLQGEIDKIPGLFNTYNFESDKTIYFIIIILELIGFWAIWNISGGSPSFIYFSIGMILLNHVIIIVSHFNSQGKICLASNQKYLYKTKQNKDDPFTKTLDNGEKWQLMKSFFGLLVFILALLKSYLYYLLSGGIVDIINIGVIITFLLSAYFYVFHAGYFFSELIVNYHLKKDYQKFLATGKSEQNKYWVKGYRVFPFHSEVPIAPITIDNGRHYLETISNHSDYNCQFRSWGLLTDDDLATFSSAQTTPNASLIINSNGLDHQLQILNENAKKATTFQEQAKKKPSKSNGIKAIIEEESINAVKLSMVQKTDLKSEIGKNNTLLVINKLIENANETNYNIINTLLSLQSQYNKIIHDSTKGIINYDEEIRQRNKINNNLMEIIDSIE